MRAVIVFLESICSLNTRAVHAGTSNTQGYCQGQGLWFRTVLIVMTAFIFACQSLPAHSKKPAASDSHGGKSANEFLVVDCLLPGQLRRMGSRMNYLSPRRPVKTSASDCEIRGGEYVAFDRADYSTALKIWLPQAKEGDPVAQTYVGEIYEKGLGLDPDYQFAAYWYEQAVQQGYSRALINLGHLYEVGLGVERDPRKALNMYRQASGIEGDQLLFASSLVSTHVPKAQFQSVQGALTAERQHSTDLERDLALLQRDMSRRSAQLQKAEAQLASTAEKITLLTSSSSAGHKGLASKAEAELAGELQSLESERSQLQQQVALLDSKNQQLQQSSTLLAAQLSDGEKSQQKYQQQLQQLQQETGRSQQRMLASEQEVAELNQQLAQQQDKQSISDASLQQLNSKLDARNAALLQARQQHLALESDINKREQQLQAVSEDYARQSQQVSGSQLGAETQKQRLAAELQQREQQLQDTDYQLLLAKAALQMERAKVSQVAGQTAEQQAQMTRQRAELAELSSSLQQQYALVKTQQGKISELEQQSKAVKSEKTSAVEIDDRVAVRDTSPRIEIIEPPVVLVRSMPTVKLLSRGGERQLVGKVLAPGGILSLSVNGQPVELGNNNLFHTKIALDVAPKPVNVVVVDNQGRRAAVTFTFVEEIADVKSQEAISTATPPSKKLGRKSRVKMGNYHALIIGNNDYQQFSTLATAVNDARETEKLLRQKYKFKTKLLLNADRYTILSALNELRQTLDEDDNLLIYYAGHGMLDESNGRGYWLPVDADVSNNANWISNTAITDILNVINAKHILVVADSCFSGTLTQSPLARSQVDVPADVRNEWIKVMAETRARITLTSGGLEPVLDGGGGEHSLFSKAFLATLRDNEDILEGYSLYYQILNRMGSSEVSSIPQGAGQVPQYAPIHLAGHESGEFFFSPI
jgi:hypothetical protein